MPQKFQAALYSLKFISFARVKIMKSYAIIGTGAIGGYIAAMLSRVNFAVHCLARSDYQYIKQRGLTIIECGQEWRASVKTYDSVEQMPRCDVVIVALKATANGMLSAILPHVMHNDSIVVVVQNGIGVEQALAKFILPEKIVGAICMIKVTKIAPGLIDHSDLNSMTLAQYFASIDKECITPAVESVVSDLLTAGIKAQSSSHLPTVRWQKLASNIASHALPIIFDVSTQEILSNSNGFDLFVQITKEVIATANQCGAKIPAGFLQQRIEFLRAFSKSPKSYPSMKIDFDAGRELELEAVYENTLAVAKAHHIEMPLTEMLYRQLMFLVDCRDQHQSVN